VNNPSVATPGRDVETEDEFRERREADLDRPGSARVKAIRSDLLQVEGVQSVTFLENCTGLRDTKNGLPAHSFEMIIWAGSPSAAETSDIAAAIDASRAGGGQSHGRNSGPVLDPPNPPSIERFTLATGRDVYLVFDVVTNDEWVDVDTFETAIATELNAIHDIGDRVVSERVQALAFREGMGVEDLTAFALGFAAAPTNDENLKIGVREIARFDTTRIVVNVIS
jgi:hypothetical protein